MKTNLLAVAIDMNLRTFLAVSEELEEDDAVIQVDMDLKVYEPGNMYEIPLALPVRMVDSGYLIPGPYSIQVRLRQSQWEAFRTWARDHERVIKLIDYKITNT